MTREEAANILDPETTLEAYAKISYYGGFEGENVWQDAVNEACRMGAAALRELDEYKKAESEGRLVVLPCKVGDSYFAVRKFCDEHGELEEPVEHWDSDCCGCNLPCNAELEVTEWKFKSIRHIIAERESIGVSIFLTREEAERALEKVCKKNT